MYRPARFPMKQDEIVLVESAFRTANVLHVVYHRNQYQQAVALDLAHIGFEMSMSGLSFALSLFLSAFYDCPTEITPRRHALVVNKSCPHPVVAVCVYADCQSRLLWRPMLHRNDVLGCCSSILWSSTHRKGHRMYDIACRDISR